LAERWRRTATECAGRLQLKGRGKVYENEKMQWRRGPFGAGSRQGESGEQTSSLIVQRAQAKGRRSAGE
jgi:hypothetical protein